jgi:AmmeMemoRadiSam system protein B
MSVNTVRPPAVAGRFYPAAAAACVAEARSYLQNAPVTPGAWVGGVVPHAGWICSGAVAGQTIATLAAAVPQVDVVVVFGAVHTAARFEFGALDSHGRWALPGGEAQLPLELQQRLLGKGTVFGVEPRLHQHEHAVEVEVPLLQLAWPGVAILPIEVPAHDVGCLIGRKTAQTVREAGLRAVYLASSDFTHYGTNYHFTPAGVGPAAMQWARDNDRPLLELLEQMAAERIVAEVHQRQNACGAGALAAMLAACREVGATAGRTLRHTTSFETLAGVAPQSPTNSVGYAAVVVGCGER